MKWTFTRTIVYGRSAGQSRLMQSQQNSPDPPDQERDNFSARRQDFSEAAVRNGLKGRNPNRPFATGVFYVSVAAQFPVDVFQKPRYYSTGAGHCQNR